MRGGASGGRRDVDEELRLHIEQRTEENIERGMDPAAARDDALRRFGDVDRIRAACLMEDERAVRARERADRTTGWRHDLRYGFRVLRRSPIYASIIVATLAFGIGANVVVFSALSPYFVRALPFAAPDRLLHLFTWDAADGWDKGRFSLPQYEDVRERTRAFTGLAAYHYGMANLSGDETAEQIQIGMLTANAFDVLGSPALMGRTFQPGEAGPGGADVVVLGWGLWQRRHAGDEQIVGRSIRVNGVPHTVIGVMPKDFNFPFGGVKAWLPMRETAATESRDRYQFLLFGRLAGGWTRERARDELDGIWRALAAEHPDTDGRLTGIHLLGMRPALNFAYDVLTVAFFALTGAVAFVLLIACANITGLGLARALSRRQEVAIRTALGAGRVRLVRQFLIESSILAVVGGSIGLLLAWLIMRAAGPVFPEDLYAVGEFGLDRTALAFTLVVTGLAAVLIGTVPALSAATAKPGDALREGGRSRGAGRRTSRLRAALVMGEMALGLVLVVGAGLLARSLGRISDVPLGFEPDGVLSIELTAPSTVYPDAADYGAFYDRVIEVARTVPGAAAAAAVAHLPLNHETSGVGFAAPGQPTEPDRLASAELFRVSPGYFETMRIRAAAGRGIEAQDRDGAEAVAVVGRTLADRHLDGDAVGTMLLIGDRDALRPVRVVGVVDDVRHSSITESPAPQIYLSLAQSPARRRFLVVRADGDAPALAAALRTAVGGVDPDVPANRLRPMTDLV
ncbi:MAG: ADOP family duplicated permease, partial [Gemmatimonadetes bacterium]|nr:ADOP family duplicated permease [Gemmatimonadota bacterium]